MTISKETLSNLAEGILEMQKSGFRLEAALAQGVEWNDDDAFTYFEQLKILMNAYFGDESLSPINILTKPLATIGTTTSDLPQVKFCGTGTNMVTYDVDGKAYGCHMFSPVVQGSKKAIEIKKIDWSTGKNTEDQNCVNCVLKCWCPTCLGFNYKYRGVLSLRDKRWCKMILAEALVACEFQIKYLTEYHRTWDGKDCWHAQCALNAYDVLQHFCISHSTPPYKYSN